MVRGLLRKTKENIYKIRCEFKYYGYKPWGIGLGMKLFVDYIKIFTKIDIKNIFEIGANFAQDADYLAYTMRIKPQNVYVFEAHPELYEKIVKIHNFNAYNCAVFNEEKEIDFNIVPINSTNTGLSSMLELKDNIATKKVSVKAIRMDNFLNKNNIETISFLKLDVEGVTYEVLEGFGERIKDIEALHIEAEHGEVIFKANKYFDDISELLKRNGFDMVYFYKSYKQSDSFWVKKEMLKR